MQTHVHISWCHCQCKMQMLSTDTPANSKYWIKYSIHTQWARRYVFFFFCVCLLFHCLHTKISMFSLFGLAIWLPYSNRHRCQFFITASTSFLLTMTYIFNYEAKKKVGRIMFVCDIANRIIHFDIYLNYFTTKHRFDSYIVFVLSVSNVCYLFSLHSTWYSIWHSIACVDIWLLDQMNVQFDVRVYIFVLIVTVNTLSHRLYGASKCIETRTNQNNHNKKCKQTHCIHV